MKRFLMLAAALAALGPAAALAQAQARPTAVVAAAPRPAPLTGEARAQAIAAANRALNAQAAVQGRFRQVAPDGSVASGVFYLQRPGRLRFEYDPPASLLIVADGSVVAVNDRALRTTNRSPLRETPLYFVLKSNLDLNRDARVTAVTRDGPAILIAARDRAGQADGVLTLRFVGPGMTLQGWDVVDASGATTRVVLTEQRAAARFEQRLFQVPRDQLPRSGRP